MSKDSIPLHLLAALVGVWNAWRQAEDLADAASAAYHHSSPADRAEKLAEFRRLDRIAEQLWLYLKVANRAVSLGEDLPPKEMYVD